MKEERELPGLDGFHSHLISELSQLKEKNRLRTLEFVNGIDFISNDTLSLNASGKLTSLVKKCVREWEGAGGSTGSRLLQGQSPSFKKAESDFSEFAGYEDSLLYQSGYAANTGTIPALAYKDDLILSDKHCHASLIDGIRLSGAKNIRFRHNDLNHLEDILKKESGSGKSRIWIVTETLFSMDGDMPDLTVLAELSQKYGALLYLDEAHAVGIYGPGGRGLAAEHGLQEQIAVSVYPMGKAPGFAGAFAAGKKELKEILINKSRSFIFSTAQPPFLAEILSEIISFLKTDEADNLRKNVFQHAELLRNELEKHGINTGGSASQIIPVICGDEKRALHLAEHLQNKGFAVRAIRPPSVPEGSSRLRLAVHADHTENQIRTLAEEIQLFFHYSHL